MKQVTKISLIVGFFICGCCLGFFRTRSYQHSISYELAPFENQKAILKGEVVSDPISNGQTQQFILQVSRLETNATTTFVTGKILVSTKLYPAWHYGDMVTVSGTIKKPNEIVEDDTRIFDYPDYLLKSGITEQMTFASVKVAGVNKGNKLILFLYTIKHDFVSGIQCVLPEPDAGLLAGIVLGTQTLSQKISNEFRVVGLSHIVVLSGYNITIVADAAMDVAVVFSVAFAPFVAVTSVVLFVIMSGFGASSIRAGLMAIVALLGKRYGKSYHAGRALFFTALLMILWNPYTLLYDPSFHLSFLATYAMIYISPFALQKLVFIKNEVFREILATTCAVNVFVLPYILYMSGSLSPYAIPANLLVLPLVPLTMTFGFFTGLLGIFSKSLGFIPGIPSLIITHYDIFIASHISRLPFARLVINNFSVLDMFLVYIGYFILWIFLQKKNSAGDSQESSAKSLKTVDGYEVIGD